LGLIDIFSRFGVQRRVSSVTYEAGKPFYNREEPNPHNKEYGEKLDLILKNPAALHIFTLIPDLFSMGEYVLERDGEIVDEEHPVLELLKNPNPLQTEQQLKWDYMFWRMLGTANLFSISKQPENSKLYFLKPHYIQWSELMKDNAESIFQSEAMVNQMLQQQFTYDNGKKKYTFRYEQLLQFFDTSNTVGMEGWWNGPSKIDALYKIILNSDYALKSKGVTADFAGKFLVGSQNDIEDTSSLPMNEADKRSVRRAMRSAESVYPTKTAPNIERFIDDSQVLQNLDDAFLNDAFLIGKMLKNVPKDALELMGDTTYENQEKARASLVSYCIQPDADDFTQKIGEYFGMGDEGLSIRLDYSHLPFVQVFESEKASVMSTKANAYGTLTGLGMDYKAAAMAVGLEPEDFNEPTIDEDRPDDEE
jgi:hypothetical protein